MEGVARPGRLTRDDIGDLYENATLAMFLMVKIMVITVTSSILSKERMWVVSTGLMVYICIDNC